MASLLDPDSYLLVLTGAGISAESGVPTFRGPNGLWSDRELAKLTAPDALARDPAAVWDFYSKRRANLATVSPNAGHRALVEAEQRLGDHYLLVTQNTDGLHAAAGSRRLVEFHGCLLRSRCTVCDRPPFEDRTAYPTGVVPPCELCREQDRDGILRPDNVRFGETIPPDAMRRVQEFIHLAGKRLNMLVVGTSGVVYPAAGLVDVVRARGGRTWLVNAERPANVESFDEVMIGQAGTILPQLFAS
jgi:NAD-dependent deacetylase